MEKHEVQNVILHPTAKMKGLFNPEPEPKPPFSLGEIIAYLDALPDIEVFCHLDDEELLFQFITEEFPAAPIKVTVSPYLEPGQCLVYKKSEFKEFI